MAETSTPESLPVARLLTRGAAIASGVPEGLDAAGARRACPPPRGQQGGRPILHIARDGQRLATLEDALQFFAPDVKRLSFPAWDGVPYDRVAPNAEIIARRVATLAELAEHRGGADETPLIVLTTVNAVLQRVPSARFLCRIDAASRAGQRGEHGGADRAAGACRLWPRRHRDRPRPICGARRHPRLLSAWRESGPPRFLRRHVGVDPRLRSGDPTHARPARCHHAAPDERGAADRGGAQRNSAPRYVELFGPVRGDDPLYESISAGRQHQGMEHWLPLFHERLETLFDYLPDAVVTFDPLDRRRARQAPRAGRRPLRGARSRRSSARPSARRLINPVPPESLFLTEA